MNTSNARTIADGLTWVLSVSALPITIFAAAELRWWVFGTYAIAALTDFFDGVFARLASPSRRGGAIDGNADVFFTLMTLVWIAMLFPDFYSRYGLPLVLPLLSLQAPLFIFKFRQSQSGVPHLALGRLSMFVFCFLLTVLLVLGDVQWFVVLALVLSIVAKAQLAWHMTFVRRRETTSGLS